MDVLGIERLGAGTAVDEMSEYDRHHLALLPRRGGLGPWAATKKLR